MTMSWSRHVDEAESLLLTAREMSANTIEEHLAILNILLAANTHAAMAQTKRVRT